MARMTSNIWQKFEKPFCEICEQRIPVKSPCGLIQGYTEI